jgi:hypothetical protein
MFNMSSQHGIKGFVKAAANTCCFCSERCVGVGRKQVANNFRPFISIMKTILFENTIGFFDEWNSLTTDLCDNCYAQYTINSAPLVEFRETLDALFELSEEKDCPQYNAILAQLRTGKCVFLSDVECEKNLTRKLLGERISSIVTSIPCKYESGRKIVEYFCHIKGMPDKLVQQWLIGSHRLLQKEHQQEVSDLKAQIKRLQVQLAAERNKKDAKTFLHAVAIEFGAKVKAFNKQRVSRMSTPASAEIRTAAITLRLLRCPPVLLHRSAASATTPTCWYRGAGRCVVNGGTKRCGWGGKWYRWKFRIFSVGYSSLVLSRWIACYLSNQ